MRRYTLTVMDERGQALSRLVGFVPPIRGGAVSLLPNGYEVMIEFSSEHEEGDRDLTPGDVDPQREGHNG